MTELAQRLSEAYKEARVKSANALVQGEDVADVCAVAEFGGLAGLILTGTIGGIVTFSSFTNHPISGTIAGVVTGLVSYGILRASSVISQDLMQKYDALQNQRHIMDKRAAEIKVAAKEHPAELKRMQSIDNEINGAFNRMTPVIYRSAQ